MKNSPILSVSMFLVVGWMHQINGMSETLKKDLEMRRQPQFNVNQNRQPNTGYYNRFRVRKKFENTLPSKVKAGDYKQMKDYDGFIPARYIYPAKDKSDVLFLYCYMDKDPTTKIKFYIAVIKTIDNEALFSIVGFRCMPQWDFEENHYIRVEKSLFKRQRTFYIGERDSPYDEEWSTAVICVDCGDTTGRPDNDGAGKGETIHWSQGAVEWKRGETKDYEYSRDWVAKQYVSEGKTKFVVVCIKDETKDTGQVVRSASGAFVAKARVNFFTNGCPTMNIVYLQMIFVTENAQGELKLHTNKDCKKGCDVDVGGNNKKSWLYYYKDYNLKSVPTDSDFTFRINDGIRGNISPNSCQHLSKKDIKRTLLYNSSQRRIQAIYSSGKHFRITCCDVSLPKRHLYYADIAYNGELFVTLDNFNCDEGVVSGLPNKFVTTTNNDDDISQVVVGSYDPEWTHQWCAYNVIKMPDSDTYDIELYYGYTPDSSILQWTRVTQ